jgi:colanic acid/amylovoran biosynthesis glycosyltransferase
VLFKAMLFCVSDNSHGTDDQQPSQIAVALLGDAAQTRLAAGRMLLGHQPDPSGHVATSGASVFVLASRTAAGGDMEGIPVVLMEAMAVGTPVIASRHSGIPELIEDEVTGLLVAENNPAELTEALRAVMEDAVAAEQRVRAARRQIEVWFNRPIQNSILETEILRLVAGAQ